MGATSEQKPDPVGRAISEFDAKVSEALKLVPPSRENRAILVEYFLALAARLVMQSRGELEEYLERARSCFARVVAISDHPVQRN